MEHTTHTNTEEQAIDLSVLLRRMLRALRRLWPVCLALIVLCAALMGWRSHRSFRPMYRSEAVFSVNLSFVGGTDLSGYSQYYNKSAAQQVADTFPYLLTSDRMQELLLQRLGVTYLNGVISSSAIKDTSFFVLTVESPNPQDAYDILCAVIDVYPQVNRLVLGETQLVVNQEPSLPDAPYNSDPWVRSAVKGAFLGLVLDLAQELTPYTGRIRLFVVPFTKLQELLRERCPEDYFTILMRRYMMRVAERIALREDCGALITGESLGQVASQTAEALVVTDAVVKMPVMRPLIAMDKVDIMDKAQEIGTYDISIQPYEDCCTVFLPKHPVTKPKLKNIEKSEEALDVDALVKAAVDSAETVLIEPKR